MPGIETTPEFVASAYENLERGLEVIRGRLDRPLTERGSRAHATRAAHAVYVAEAVHADDTHAARTADG